MFTNGLWGKWGLGANGHLGERQCPKGVFQVPFGPISPKFSQTGAGKNGHLGKMSIWIRGAPSALILCSFPLTCLQIGSGANGHLGKCTFGGKRYPKCPKRVFQVRYAHYPKWLELGTGANGHFGQMDIWAPFFKFPFAPLSIFKNLGNERKALVVPR